MTRSVALLECSTASPRISSSPTAASTRKRCSCTVVAAALDDTKLTAKEPDSGKTFHNYGRLLFSKQKPIDFIFVTKGTCVLRYKIIDNTVHEMYLSDHYGLCADLAL